MPKQNCKVDIAPCQSETWNVLKSLQHRFTLASHLWRSSVFFEFRQNLYALFINLSLFIYLFITHLNTNDLDKGNGCDASCE